MRIDNLEDENECLRDMLNDIAYALGLDMLKVHYYSEDNYAECQKTVLHEIGGRLMPEGMKWPCFEDGEPVRFGDKFMTPYGTCSEVAYITFIGSNGYELAPHGFHTVINSRGHDASIYYEGQRVRRPFILAKDGEPIIAGRDTIYGEDGRAWAVVKLHYGKRYSVEADSPYIEADGVPRKCWTTRRLKPEWLTHKKPALAADGKPIKVDETVYRVDGVDGNFVAREVGINPWNKRWDVTVDCVEDRELYTFEPSQLTHEKPILAADGKPIKVGSTLYSEDGRDWHVLDLRRDLLYPVKAEGPAIEGEKLPSHGGRITKLLRADLLTHEKPDTWDSFEHDLFIELSDKSGYSEDVRKEAVAAFVDRAKKLAERMVRNEQQSRIAE